MTEYTTGVVDQRNVSPDERQRMPAEIDQLLNTMSSRGWDLKAMTSVPSDGGLRVLHTFVFTRSAA